MDSKRILVTGLSTYWGGRLAQALEAFDEVEAVIGVAADEPQVELERTEYVKVGAQHALLRRVVEAAEIDTVVDTRLVVDSATTSPGRAHENNVIGTMNILAACSGADSPVRKVVFKSSTHFYGCEQDDPAFFDETMDRPHPPRTPIERDIIEAEASLGDFADRNPDVSVTVLRFANVLGPSVRTSHVELLSLPVVPMILGFDPRYQFVHEDDVVHALEHAVKHDLPGVYNVAGDGVLALSEVAGLLQKPYLPMLPPWGTGLAAAALQPLGIKVPAEMLAQLRFGRGVDNRRYKAKGFHYKHTTRETVLKLGEHLRLDPIMRGAREPYRYEREVEEFLRWSPHVRRGRAGAGIVGKDQLAELRRLLGGFSETVRLEELGAADGVLAAVEERARAAEARAAHAEALAREAEERAARAEARAQETTERAMDGAKKAERRAAEAALEATERAKRAERRARAAAEEALELAAQAERRARAAWLEGAEERPETPGRPEQRAETAERPEQRAETPERPEPQPEPRPEPPPEPRPEPQPPRSRPTAPLDHYDDLADEEVIAMLEPLELDDLRMLRDHERRHANRRAVIEAIDVALARGSSRV